MSNDLLILPAAFSDRQKKEEKLDLTFLAI